MQQTFHLSLKFDTYRYSRAKNKINIESYNELKIIKKNPK